MEYYPGTKIPRKKYYREKIFVNFQHSSCAEAEEVQVDAQANVKPIFLKTEGGTIQVTAARLLFACSFKLKFNAIG